MIVLHAGVDEDQLLLWGEKPIEEGNRTSGSSRKGAQRPQVERLAYDAGRDALSEALAQSGVGYKLNKKRLVKQVVWLPTAGKTPVPSSPLIAERPSSRAGETITPWGVTVLCLTVEETVGLLSLCVGKKTLAPGVIVGEDLAFWTTALRFAGTLVARHRFLPGIAENSAVYCSRWEPVLLGTDAEQMAKLARAMPAVARALTPEASSAPAAPPASVLSGFITGCVDYLVRSGLLPVSQSREARRGGKKKAAAFESVHEQWLHSLRSPDGVMEGDEAELSQLSAQVREWQRPVSASRASPFRLCFRLEEPEAEQGRRGTADQERPRPRSADPLIPCSRVPTLDGESRPGGTSVPSRPDPDAWYVRYLLQAADDPSLLVEAKDGWKASKQESSVLKRRGFDSREYLLSSLGQASGLCPRIEGSLRTSQPSGYIVDGAGAHEFLTEKALALEQAGFGVMLPAWWTGKATKVRLTARANVKSPSMQAPSGLSLDAIVRFDWEIALGDEKLSLEELDALARLKSPLVRVRGQWVHMSSEEIQAAIDLLKKKGKKATLRDAVQMALGATTTATGGVAFEGVRATGWIADLFRQLEGKAAFEEQVTPEEFRGTLRPYQVRGYSWLFFLKQWGFGTCLADDMGLGKTIQALALIQRDWASNSKRPVLLVCPTSVIGNWQKEAARFTPNLPVMVHHGVTRSRGEAFKDEALKHAIVISSYSLLHRDIAVLQNVPWLGVILDEAQNIKNPETKQAKAARSLKPDYCVALTGTPVENNIADLWSIMEFLNPGFLGSQSDFKKRFFIPIQANRDPEAAKHLKRLTGPFLLRRLKTDKSIIADLPEKLEMKVFCTLTKEQASLYAAVVKDVEESLDSAEGIQRKGIVLAALSKLKQVCNHPRQLLGDNSPIPGRSGKLARLTEMLEEVVQVGDRALVFSQFAEMGEILRRHLQETFGQEVLFLHGTVPKKHRDSMIERFQGRSDGPQIFVLSLKAGGTGLNLMRANHVFHFDRWWNPAVENQATDRVFRIGQTKNVQVHKFLCVGTLEEKIDEMIERKKEIAEQVVGAGEAWLTELSTAELRKIFALREHAVAQ